MDPAKKQWFLKQPKPVQVIIFLFGLILTPIMLVVVPIVGLMFFPKELIRGFKEGKREYDDMEALRHRSKIRNVKTNHDE